MTDLPTTMPAAIYREKGVLEVAEVETPAVGPHDVLLEVSHCGVCGSDIHFVLEGWGTPDAIEGHEYTGVVAAVGSEVTRWTVGQPVVAGPSRRCGDCEPCRLGRPSLCLNREDVGTGGYQGAFARYSLTHEDEVLALTQLANPKPAVLFSAIFIGTVPPGTAPWVYAALLMVAFLNETVWNILVARIFSFERTRAGDISLKTVIDRSFGGLLAVLGIKIAAT